MFLVGNERMKLMAAYANGLAIASAAIGGIGQIANVGVAGASWSTAAWIVISLALHGIGQLFITRLRE